LGNGHAVVRHIAVDEACRQRGIGRAMIEHAREAHGPRSLTAETDQDAVGFYERCGFSSQAVGTPHPPDRYPSAERFVCTLGPPPT
jgi:ribosomal protein S18 acetylase RimI-like enzyme